MKKILLLAFLISSSFHAFSQGSESFESLDASGSSYVSGSYTGDNSVTWTYSGTRSITSTYIISGSRSCGFGSSGSRFIRASSGTNGVGDLSFTISSYFTGGNASNRTIEVFVDGTSEGSFTLASMGTDEPKTISGINATGDVLIEFRSTGSRQIALDDVSWTAAVLPVELTYFSTEVRYQYIELDWQTSMELNNSHFEVQYSTDSHAFKTLEKVQGAGDSYEKVDYNFTHDNPARGMNYYRLRQVDFDGTVNYSDIVSVKFGDNTGVSVYPNPTTADLTLAFTEELTREASADIFNQSGAIVKSAIVSANTLNTTINVADLPAGIYFVRVVNGNTVDTQRFVKK